VIGVRHAPLPDNCRHRSPLGSGAATASLLRVLPLDRELALCPIPPRSAPSGWEPPGSEQTVPTRTRSGLVGPTRCNARAKRWIHQAQPPTNAAVSGSGHGLRGMRERVEMCGGWVTAQPESNGGFAIRSSIPIVTAGP